MDEWINELFLEAFFEAQLSTKTFPAGDIMVLLRPLVVSSKCYISCLLKPRPHWRLNVAEKTATIGL